MTVLNNQFTNRRFTSFAEVRTGLLWTFDRVTEEQKWQRYWANDRVNIQIRERGFEPNTPAKKTIRYNWFRTVSEFYTEALWSETPIIEGIDNPTLARAFEEATRWRSMKGYGVVLYDSDVDKYMSIDPSLWHPVLHPQDQSVIIGHILAYPWHTNPDDQAGMPNRLDLVLVGAEADGTVISERRTYQMEGNTLGALVQTTEIPTPTIVTFGIGVSDYVDIEDLVLELENRLYRSNRTLDRHSNPHIQGPVAAKDDSGGFDLDEEGSFLPRDDDDPEYAYLTWDAKLDSVQRSIDNLIDALHVMTGVPSTVFGMADKSEQSATSRERQLFVALKKVQGLRREVNESIVLLGGSVSWSEMPFAGFAERAATMIELKKEGIIDGNEARQRLGIPGDAPTPQPTPRPGNDPGSGEGS